MNIKKLATTYKIISLDESQRLNAVNFALNFEVECTALVEQLLKSSNDIFVLQSEKFLAEKNIIGLFYIKNHSTIFHCLPFFKNQILENSKKNFSQDEIKKILKTISKFLENQKIFCVYGEYFSSFFLTKILEKQNRKLTVSREYILMKKIFNEYFQFKNSKYLNSQNQNLQLQNFQNENLQKEKCFVTEKIQLEENLKSENFYIKKCDESDLNSLIELQKNYRKEEVLIDEKEENDFVVKHLLKEMFDSQEIFACYKKCENQILQLANSEKKSAQNEFAISKAGTNAKGKNFFQIGGVYCNPEFRNKKITFCVMQNLLENIKAQGKNANLFVQIHNESAKKLYKNLGFVECGKFLISYFQK